MKYKVTLNGITYEVEVSKDEAAVIEQYTSKLPAPTAAAPAAAPAPVAPAAAPAPAAPAAAPAPAAPAAGGGEGEAVKAPLPGSVVGIKVAVGQSVKAGDLLVVIEAMKMENDVVSPRDGVVSGIAVSQGQSVETGTVILTLK